MPILLVRANILKGFDLINHGRNNFALCWFYLNLKGPALTKALAEIVQKRPADPVEYLANYLHKYVKNQEQMAKDKENEKVVREERALRAKERENEKKLREEMEQLNA